MKKRYIPIFLSFLFCTQAFSQAYTSWSPGSTIENNLYDATNLPGRSTPKWIDFFVNPENSEYMLNEGKLKLKTSAGSIYGFQIQGENFSPENAFTFDIKAEQLTNTAALDVNMNLQNGKSVKLSLKKDTVLDIKTGEILANKRIGSDLQNYRIAVDGDDAVLYKGENFVTVLNLQADDVVKDGGFESMTSEEASNYWDHSSWSGISVVTEKKHSGEKSMKWDSGWTGQFLGNVKVQPNTSYELSYWAEFSPQQTGWGANQMSGGIYMDGIEIASLPISGSGWREYKCSFTTAQTTKDIMIYYHNGWTGNGNFIIYFDDIKLTRKESSPFLQIGNLYNDKDSEINIGKISFYNGTAFRPINSTDLSEKLTEAEALLDASGEGFGAGEYPPYAIERFNSLIKNTKDIKQDTTATSEDIEIAYTELIKAIEIFKKSEITDPSIVLESISANIDKNPLKRNQIAQIGLTGKLSDDTDTDLSIANIKYISLTPNIVGVDSVGNVSGLKEGNAKIEIQATLNNVTLKDTLKFNVIEYVLTDIKFNAYNLKIEAGEATGTYFEAKMSDQTTPSTNDIFATYKSLDTTIADITTDGTVIAKKKGIAKLELSATVFDKTIKDTVEINIVEIESIEIIPTKTTLNNGDISSYSLSARFTDGSSLTLNATNSYVWSSNRGVIKVNDDGLINASAPGSSIIEVTVNRFPTTKKETITLLVEDDDSGIGSNNMEGVKVYPIPFNNTLTIESDSKLERIEIFEISGKKILSKSIHDKNKEEIETNTLQEGPFVLQIQHSDKTTKSIIVIKK